ncbi:AMP-binding protein [Halomonas sp. CKK8]|uniref:AMP-binding protein n=1 Tax=Halomonas sp. CKK8 TaxID=3036127 RepID=UPI002414E808|nr:AMP-binding protein [Halomonas sp. CKK8]WFM69984.1 AMP-binding protein [Halomonas sp. CKK8]
MANALLPRLLYRGFDLVNKGELGRYYRAASDRNRQHLPFARAELEAYARRWGFDPVLEHNPLMDKAAIRRWTEKVSPGDVHGWAYTGGSSGEPLRVPYSKQRGLMRTATFTYFNEAAGYQLGDPFFLIRAKSRSPLMKYLRNEHIFLPGDISAPRIREFVEALRDKKIKVLMGYPSVMYEVALYLEQHPSEKEGLQVRSLISISEPLEPVKRDVIHQAFGCAFVDRYSNEEVGLMAQQAAFGGEYYVNKFGVYVEVVDPTTSRPVAEGEQGRVVVTDIGNDLIPIIRYDTGDLATAACYREGQLLTLREVVGRVSEQIVSVAGNSVSPLMLGPYIYKPLLQQGPVYQYQFAQTGAGQYEVRLKAGRQDIADAVIQEIIDGLTQVLGHQAAIKVVFCDDIPPQPSGKRPIYKNEMVTGA